VPRDLQDPSLAVVGWLRVAGSQMEAVGTEQREEQENGQGSERAAAVASKSLNAAQPRRGGEKELIIFADLAALTQLPKRQAIAFERAAFEVAARFAQPIKNVERELVLGGRTNLQVYDQAQLRLGLRLQLLYGGDGLVDEIEGGPRPGVDWFSCRVAFHAGCCACNF